MLVLGPPGSYSGGTAGAGTWAAVSNCTCAVMPARILCGLLHSIGLAGSDPAPCHPLLWRGSRCLPLNGCRCFGGAGCASMFMSACVWLTAEWISAPPAGVQSHWRLCVASRQVPPAGPF